jgi:hypothetical protein
MSVGFIFRRNYISFAWQAQLMNPKSMYLLTNLKVISLFLLPYKSQIGRGRALIYAENADKKVKISASICVYPCFPRPFLEMYGRESLFSV